jgi:hypothetical protein
MTTEETRNLIATPFDLPTANLPQGEEALLAVLSERIAEMLEGEPDYLMSLLYRLDVLEAKILPVIAASAPEPPHIGLARLVLERQKQRLATKRSVRVEPLDDSGFDF